jgi:hypothetical protein
MPFHTIIMPEALAMLTSVLERHCENHAFARHSLEREEAASFLILLFSNGVQNADRLKTALEVRKRARDPGNYRRRTRTETAPCWSPNIFREVRNRRFLSIPSIRPPDI